MHSPLLTCLLHAAFGLAAVRAHMQMIDPPPLRSTFNPNTASGKGDFSMTSPLAADGGNYPCKGYLSLLGTKEGAAVATWDAGSSYSVTISGGTTHSGGSCQLSLSLDGGASFRVIKSIIGNCPSGDGSKYDFTVPNNVGSASGAVFAWTWFNNVGNREMYMNCAVVDIRGNGGGNLADRPGIFLANVGNACRTADSRDVKFPDPGPEVQGDNGKATDAEGTGCGAGFTPSAGGDDDGHWNGGGGWDHGNGGGDSSYGNDWPGWYSGADKVGRGFYGQWLLCALALVTGVTAMLAGW